MKKSPGCLGYLMVGFLLVYVCWFLVSCGIAAVETTAKIHAEKMEQQRRAEEAHRIYYSNHKYVDGRWVPNTTPTPSRPSPTVKPNGNSSYRRPSGTTSNKNPSYADPIDPDDYDIEGYYEDHRDEFDDIDDAYDAFLDDEDAWDDY